MKTSIFVIVKYASKNKKRIAYLTGRKEEDGRNELLFKL